MTSTAADAQVSGARGEIALVPFAALGILVGHLVQASHVAVCSGPPWGCRRAIGACIGRAQHILPRDARVPAMIAKTRALTHARLVLTLSLLAGVLLVSPTLAAAAETTPINYQKESYAEYQTQLAASQIQAVTINKRLRSLRVTLKDGRHVLAKYNKKELATAKAALAAAHVPVTVLTPTEALTEVKAKPVHHKLRYIVGGGLIVVLAIVGAVLFFYRRRGAEE